jgi:iron(III) transport system ATP-binding protein
LTAALGLDGVTLTYRDQRALDRVDLGVAAGEIVALLGPSASGKTSLLRAVLGFAVPEKGTVSVGPDVVSRAGRSWVAPEDRNLGVVFQDLALWPHLTVEGHLSFGLEARGIDRAQAKDRIAAILRRLGLVGSTLRYPGQLSGGQRQRVAIARALVLEPRAVLLDEPLANVDVELKRDLLALLAELFRGKSTTVLHVTHDLREAAVLADRVAVMEAGRIVQQGTIADLGRAPATPFVSALLDDLDKDWRARRPLGRLGG